MKLSDLCSCIVVAVLMMGVGNDLLMSRMGAILAVCLLRGVGKWTDDIATLFFVYNMYIHGMFNDFSPNAIINGMQVNNLFFGGICAIYVALESRYDVPNPNIPL
jgi:hypothetical protein